MLYAYFRTFGCKVNQCETNALIHSFTEAGIAQTDDLQSADVIVINSCTVTAQGDSRVLTAIRRLRRDFPDLPIVLTGCLPQAQPELAEQCAEADLIRGTKDRAALANEVKALLARENPVRCQVTPYTGRTEFERFHQPPAKDKTRGFLKIQDGCDRFCSYCIIPFARGRSRSMPPEEIKKAAQEMHTAGHKEIVLVGINLAFYGEEFGLRLVDAVSLCAESGISRIRLGSLEPEQLSDEDLRRLSEIPQLCPQFHLSLQSGCDRTLQAMRRHYTAEEYFQLTERIRRFFPDCALTTDVMVGFPGETEEDFSASLAFVEKIGFAQVHVFPYSPRIGTKAASLSGQIPERIKTERAARMNALADRLHEQFLAAQVGKTVSVLFERENPREAQYHRGHTPNFTPVVTPVFGENNSLRKQVFRVIIKRNDSARCYGTILAENTNSLE